MYKVYGCGDWFMPCIRKSLPHSEMISKDAYKFHSAQKFADHLYKDFHPTHMRVDMTLMKRFFKAFTKATGFN